MDVYLFPAVVGGGLGDIEEVLAAGRWLAKEGLPLYLFRKPGSALPRGVDGPWSWPRHRRVSRPARTGAAALTVSPSFGVSAAPHRRERFGRGGPWEEEASAVESAYGFRRTLHVSLEEFARTLSSRRETIERLREGGVPSREIPQRLRDARAAGEVATFRAAFERFRAFSRANVVHLYTTFRPDHSFAREFPSAVQTGPLWPGLQRKSRGRSHPSVGREWVWYASPASAERIAPAVRRTLAREDPPVRLFVRSPRPWRPDATGPGVTVDTKPIRPSLWRSRFRRAELRVVTGSRSLLEAIEVGGPFLYFNGILGSGRRTRGHRPEKLRALLALGSKSRLPADVRRDLADFARGRRVSLIVRRAARRTGGWARFRVAPHAFGFQPPFDDAGDLLAVLARALGRPSADSTEIVRRVRARSNL